jgi:hypothetical protein
MTHLSRLGALLEDDTGFGRKWGVEGGDIQPYLDALKKLLAANFDTDVTGKFEAKVGSVFDDFVIWDVASQKTFPLAGGKGKRIPMVRVNMVLEVIKEGTSFVPQCSASMDVGVMNGKPDGAWTNQHLSIGSDKGLEWPPAKVADFVRWIEPSIKKLAASSK